MSPFFGLVPLSFCSQGESSLSTEKMVGPLQLIDMSIDYEGLKGWERLFGLCDVSE